MDAKQVMVFLEVTRAGSFTAAAKKLYLSVPGLVKAISRLEAEVGTPLLKRSHTGVSVTPAGAALCRLAPAYLSQHERILAEVKKAAAQREMAVEVRMTWGLLSFFPRDFLSRFVRENPDVSLSARHATLPECCRALSSGQASIGLLFGDAATADLQVLFHRAAPLYALMSDKHPYSSRSHIALSDLQTQRVLLLHSDTGVTQSLTEQLAQAGCTPQISLDTGEWDQALALIAEGFISFCLPPSTTQIPGVTTLPVEGLMLNVNFSMVMARGAALTDAERRFADYVVQIMNTGRTRAAQSPQNSEENIEIL